MYVTELNLEDSMEICQLRNLPRTEEDPHDFDVPFVSDPDSMTKLNMLIVCKLSLVLF